MCIINVRVHCPDTFTELLVDDVESTEATIECIVSTALLEVFAAVSVQNVTILPSSKRKGEYVEPEPCLG